MHILHVIQSLEFGGAEKVVIHLANKQSEHHKVIVCLVKYRGELIEEVNDGIEIICLDLGEGIHFGLPSMLRKIVRERSVDIVNVHNWGIFVESYLAVKSLDSVKLVLTVHGSYGDVAPGLMSALKRNLRHMMERRSSRSKCLGKIITVSDSIQKYIVDEIGVKPDKLLTIHNGISAYANEASRLQDQLRLVTVGRLSAIKNQKMLIDAIAIAVEENPAIRLTIVGDGPERENLECQVASLSLKDHVEFLGFRKDAQKILEQKNAFILSSDYEGISIALLEAMSQSIPAIATNVGGIPETIQHEYSGLLVPKGDVSRLADAILKMAESSELRTKMGANARKFFERNFHEDIVLQKYNEVYQSCLESTRA